MVELKIVKWLGRQAYRWSWQEPCRRRGFVFALWWFAMLFAILNTIILLASLDKAPAGAFGAVFVLWLCAFALRKRVKRNEQKQREAYQLPHRR